MTTSGKVLLLVGVLLILFTSGLLVFVGPAYLQGNTKVPAADGEFVTTHVARLAIHFAETSPGLLLPYAILFWRRPGRPAASIISAIVCGVLYPLVLGLMFLLLAILGDALHFKLSGSFADWTSALALIPGTLLAFLGTHLGQPNKSRSSAVRSQSQPGATA